MLLTKRHYMMLAGPVLLAAISGLAAARSPHHSVSMTLPELTPIHVALDQAVASDQNRPGDHFDATVSEPIVIPRPSLLIAMV